MSAHRWQDSQNTRLDDIAVHLGSPRAALLVTPEMQLQDAVLREAIGLLCTARTVDISACTPEWHRALAEARTWFASDDVRSPFAFARICETWLLDPDAVRYAVANWSGALPYHRRRLQVASPHVPITALRSDGRQWRRRTERLAKGG